MHGPYYEKDFRDVDFAVLGSDSNLLHRLDQTLIQDDL